jgi:hypothetical protein
VSGQWPAAAAAACPEPSAPKLPIPPPSPRLSQVWQHSPSLSSVPLRPLSPTRPGLVGMAALSLPLICRCRLHARGWRRNSGPRWQLGPRLDPGGSYKRSHVSGAVAVAARAILGIKRRDGLRVGDAVRGKASAGGQDPRASLSPTCPLEGSSDATRLPFKTTARRIQLKSLRAEGMVGGLDLTCPRSPLLCHGACATASALERRQGGRRAVGLAPIVRPRA